MERIGSSAHESDIRLSHTTLKVAPCYKEHSPCRHWQSKEDKIKCYGFKLVRECHIHRIMGAKMLDPEIKREQLKAESSLTRIFLLR